MTPGEYDGIPGLVWYSRVRQVRGKDLKLGDWLDTLDHRGARMIYGIWYGTAPFENLAEETLRTSRVPMYVITVMFSFGDTEQVRADVEYDVVDPDSQVAPDYGSADGDPIPADPTPRPHVPPREIRAADTLARIMMRAFRRATADGLTSAHVFDLDGSPGWALRCRDNIAGILADAAEPDPDALRAERELLVARIAEIDALLGLSQGTPDGEPATPAPDGTD